MGDDDGWTDMVMIAEGKSGGGGQWLCRNGKDTGPELTSVGKVTLPFSVCVVLTSFSTLGLSFLVCEHRPLYDGLYL